MVKLSYSCVSLRWGTDPAEYCSYEPLMGLILREEWLPTTSLVCLDTRPKCSLKEAF